MGLTVSLHNEQRVCDSCQNSPSRDGTASHLLCAVLQLQNIQVYSEVLSDEFILQKGVAIPHLRERNNSHQIFSHKRVFFKRVHLMINLWGSLSETFTPQEFLHVKVKFILTLPNTHISASCRPDLITNVQQMR